MSTKDFGNDMAAFCNLFAANAITVHPQLLF
jgi:hypothetical protein